MKKCLLAVTVGCAVLSLGIALPFRAAEAKVKVFILAGQSNMEGHGQVRSLDRLGEHPKYGYLLKKLKNADGSWATRTDVTISWTAKDKKSGPLTVGWGYGENEIGPELMFGTICQWHVRVDEQPVGLGIIKAYSRNLSAMFRDLRKDLGTPDMPIVIGEMGIGGHEIEARAKNENDHEANAMMAFRRAQKAVGDDQTLKNVTFVPTADFWDSRLQELRTLSDAYSNEKRKKGIKSTQDNHLPTKELNDEFLRLGVHWYCHYNGSAANYSLVGYALAEALKSDEAGTTAGQITAHSRGLHGYVGYSASRPSDREEYSAGMGFYSAVWPLIEKPIAHFQIGLPSAWITPDNSDNKDTPLAPIGTLARDNWPERGPTWSSVFQTVEGGLGYWARNRFRYGPPKFSMNATPQCYDYEVGSPGWSFFYSSTALPDNRLGIAQLSNRLLIPPDALPFQGNPNGKFLGYTYMALPFTKPTTGDPPTGDQSWTCFLSASNFKGPIAYYIPETWSKIGKVFDYSFIYGRGLDARPGNMGGGAMEINTVPRFDATDSQGVIYSKLPKLQFPVDDQGRTLLVQDVTYYSKAALYDAVRLWRDGGSACSGRFNRKGAWKSTLKARTPGFNQAGNRITGVDEVFQTKVFEGNVWGLEWHNSDISPNGVFPQYCKHVGDKRVAVSAADVPAETGLLAKVFKLASPGKPYTSPTVGAWSHPGPVRGPFTVNLADGSMVTYCWYRFVDQPSFQQYDWSQEKKARLQSFIEKLHENWSIDRDYMAPPSMGTLATLDPALLVTPPDGLEVGYVPIVTRQEVAPD